MPCYSDLLANHVHPINPVLPFQVKDGWIQFDISLLSVYYRYVIGILSVWLVYDR
jgi:hypothetical protein